MCGNNGDPIYHAQFIKLCSRLKDINSTLEITTNGSGKKKSWWKTLCSTLSGVDTIIFSIDGLEDTNHLYRKNAKWNTIMDGIEIVTQHNIKTVWKFIVFKHNQHQIDEAEKLSRMLGIRRFSLRQSDRWLGHKDLMPDSKYVNHTYKDQQSVLDGTDEDKIIKQQCMSVPNGGPDKGLYIDAEGNFYPCCYMGTYRYKYKSLFSPKQNSFNILDKTFNQIMEDSSIKDFFESTKQFTSAHECCKLQCGVKNG
jgi:sulfatase maturation enzyme AslB (radical SAM superfamily)